MRTPALVVSLIIASLILAACSVAVVAHQDQQFLTPAQARYVLIRAGFPSEQPSGASVSSAIEAQDQRDGVVRVAALAEDPPVEVPLLTGLDLDVAATTLVGLGLQVGEVREVHDPTVAKGRVLSQVPPAGSLAPEGFMVDLTVSAGP